MKRRALTVIEWGALRRLSLEMNCALPVEVFTRLFDQLPEPNYGHRVMWDLAIGGLIVIDRDAETVMATDEGLRSWHEIDVLGMNYRVPVSEAYAN